MSARPTIMIVAGGQWQVPLIRKAKALGAFVVNSNLYADSPGFQYADVGVVADVRDFEANLAFARQYRPDAILTDQSDIAVPTVARLCAELGLPGIGVEAARRFTDKSLMREICRREQLPTPFFRVCRAQRELQDFFREHDACPLVVKPIDSQSSRGVARVDSVEQLSAAFDDAVQYSSAGGVIAEEFIPGVELTVEGIKTNARHHTLAVSTKTHFDHSPMVARSLLYQQHPPGIDLEALHGQHDRLIAAMDLSFGLTHAEYKYWNGKLYLVEVAARGGGTNLASTIVPLMSGIDTYQLLLEMALGCRVDELPRGAGVGAVLLEFFEFPSGTVRAVSGLEAANRIPGVVEAAINFGPGATLRPSRDDRARHMFVIALGSGPEEVQQAAQRAHAAIRVDYTAAGDAT